MKKTKTRFLWLKVLQWVAITGTTWGNIWGESWYTSFKISYELHCNWCWKTTFLFDIFDTPISQDEIKCQNVKTNSLWNADKFLQKPCPGTSSLTSRDLQKFILLHKMPCLLVYCCFGILLHIFVLQRVVFKSEYCKKASYRKFVIKVLAKACYLARNKLLPHITWCYTIV